VSSVGGFGSKVLAYQQAFERICAEFLEMPGMRLTAQQLERLSGVDRAVCACVLDDLTRAGFLSRWTDGSYGKSTDDSVSRSGRVPSDGQRPTLHAAHGKSHFVFRSD
jgi:hypothetical protein